MIPSLFPHKYLFSEQLKRKSGEGVPSMPKKIEIVAGLLLKELSSPVLPLDISHYTEENEHLLLSLY